MIESNPLAASSGRRVVDPTEIRPTTTTNPYPVPDLFPDSRGLRRADLREYVEGVMEDLASDGRLILTDLLVQPSHLRDVAGRVITGEWIDYEEDNVQRMDASIVPPAVADYVVRVRLLPPPDPKELSDWKPNGPDTTKDQVRQELARRWPKAISWKRGMLPRKQRTFSKVRETMKSDFGSIQVVEEARWSTEKDEADFRIQHAWGCLRQHGKYCKRASRQRSRLLNWHYVEVPQCPDCGEFYELDVVRHKCSDKGKGKRQ